jgi:thiamine biosynthesis lipoprotein
MRNRFFALAALVTVFFISSASRRMDHQPLPETNESKEEPRYEVTVELELPRFEGRSHRPFVAVWVENKKKNLVANVALWYNKPRWLHDLKQWFSQNSDDQSRQLDGVTSATRSPGTYTIKWNLKDKDGNEVKSGKYILYIEAAREHGTYQVLKQEINLNEKPQHYSLTGGVEIVSAFVDYHAVASN